ncbi:GMC oxidoreductase [Streptomyces collinus]|uniref:GMC oxidoreductase n=1 Tax=Streptomyces collinus TaxID=42684 RepID=UPI0033A5048C
MTETVPAGPRGGLPERCRIAVVGSGLAGLSLARELAEHGADGVVVLEAGPDRGHAHKELLTRDESLKLWHTEDPDFHRAWASEWPPHYVHSSGLRRRLGGRSLYWHGVCLPVEEQVLRSGAWPPALAAELLGEGLPEGSLYDQVGAQLADWAGAPLGHCRSTRERRLVARLRELGHPVQPTPQAARCERLPGGEVRQVPFTPLTHWRGPVPLPLPYPVLPDCPVTHLRTASDGSVEVTVGRRGGPAEVLRADQVVLAGGTFENTRLVGRVLAETHGLDSWEFDNLTDHVNQGFVVTVPRATMPLPPEPGRAFCFTPELDTCRSYLFFDVMESPRPDTVLMCVWTMGEQVSTESRVRVERVSPGGQWELGVQPTISPADDRIVERQAARLAEVAERVFGIDPLTYSLRKEDFREGGPLFLPQLRAALGHDATVSGGAVFPYVYPLGSVDHEAGTLALGGDAVDEDGTVRVMPRVSVLGPAVFPRQGAANPSLTTLALAKWYARRLCSR